MNIKILFLCLLFGSLLQAQPENVIKDLNLRITPTKLDKNLPFSIQNRMDQKVIDIFTQNDLANRKESTFAVYPMLGLIEYGKLEGLSNEVTVSLELGLLVKNIFSDQYILIFSHKLNGSGSNRQVAINRAISSIRPQRKIYADFIESLQQKIQTYYSEECNAIVAQANRAIQNNNYEKAISLLYILPSDSECRLNNQALLDQAYSEYQKQNCQAFLQQANVAVLKKDFKDAIDWIAQVDPTSPCQQEAKTLLNDITQKVDEQSAKKMAFLNKVYQDNVELEKARQQSMKSISNTYIEGIKKD